MSTTDWIPHPKQMAMQRCPVTDVFYGGSRGCGKTEALLGDWMAHAFRYGEHAVGAFFRRSYPELEEVQRRCMQLFPHQGAKFNEVKHQWTWPNGATFRLRYLKRDKDVASYQGHQWTWMGNDELTNWASLEPIDLLRANLRSPHGVPCVYRASGNPGGPGHNLVKARYVEPSPPGKVFASGTGNFQRVFIPASPEDNPTLMQNDPEYWDRLELLTAGRQDLLKAWRFGDWDIVAGGYFDDVWSTDIHVVEPFIIPQAWYVDRSHDWGYSKPFCTLWFARSDGEALEDGRSWPKNTLFVIGEDYGWNGKPNEGCKASAPEIAKRVKQTEVILRDTWIQTRVRPGPADDPLFDTSRGVSMEQDMRQAGVSWLRPAKGPGSRVTGATRVRAFLQNSLAEHMERPGLFIFNTCRHLIRTLPVLPRDDDHPDDVQSDSEDHSFDALKLRLLAYGARANTRLQVVT